MTIKETKKMVEQTNVEYIAEDGKIFSTAEDCKTYEYSNRVNELAFQFDRIAKEVSLGILRWLGEYQLFKVTMQNEEDFYIIDSYCRNVICNYAHLDKPTEFPCTKMLIMNPDSEWANWYNNENKEVWSLETTFEELKNLLGK